LFTAGGPNRRYVGALLSGAAVSIVLAGACADSDQRVPSVSVNAGAGAPGVPDVCATPNEGCDCDAEGTEVDCGRIRETYGDYVTCQMGTRTCEDGQWGACVGDRITVKSTTPLSSGPRPQGLGSPVVCGSTPGTDVDPCDPYCNITPDTPGGVDAGPNFSATDAGLTLVAVGDAGVPTVPCTMLSIVPTAATVTAGMPPYTTVVGFFPVTTSPAGPIAFTVTATGAGGVPCDVMTPFPAVYTVDKVDRAQTAGTNSANGTLTVTPIAGPLTVTVYALGLSATTQVNVKVNVLEVPQNDSGDNYATTSAIANGFGTNCWTQAATCRDSPAASNTTATAVWLYPYADTFLPLGLLPLDVQYKYTTALAMSANPAVKVSLRYPAGSTLAASSFNYSVIVDETNTVQRRDLPTQFPSSREDPQVRLGDTAWSYFERTARGQDATLIVQRHRGGSSGNQLEAEVPRNIHFVDGQLKGRVYYNSYNSVIGGSTATSVFGAVLKIDPADTAPTRALPYDATGAAGLETNGTCTVCHTVSSQGNSLIVASGYTNGPGCNNSVDDSATGTNYRGNSCSFSMPASTWIATYPNPGAARYKFNYGAPYPDGSFYLTNAFDNDESYKFASALLQVSNGNTIASTAAPTLAITPAFSHDGRAVAYNDGWTAPARASQVNIAEVSPCAQFGGAYNGGEGAQVRNLSPAALDMSLWTIRNGAGTTCYTIGAGVMVASGANQSFGWTGNCLADTTAATSIRLHDAGGALRDNRAYTLPVACTSTANIRRGILSCAAGWSYGSGSANDTTNDACGAVAGTGDETGPDIRVKDFDCNAAAGSTTCVGASKTFSGERTVVSCGSTGCITAGNPSFLPDNTGILYQHVLRVPGTNNVFSRLNTWYGALGEIWLTSKTQPFTPIRLNNLNGYTSTGSYLPTTPRDVSVPTGYNNNFHSATGAAAQWVGDACSQPPTNTTVYENQLNYIPTVSPQEAGNKYWAMFTSRRMYGNVAISSPWQAQRSDDTTNYFGNYCTTPKPGTCRNASNNCSSANAYGPNSGLIEAKKLWVSAIDKTWSAGGDPSHPPFYLRGQELDAGNSHGIWVASACAGLNATCVTHDDCCNGTGASPTRECRIVSTAGAKECRTIGTCSAAGAACATTANCCSGLTCPAGGGVCLTPPPPVVSVPTFVESTVTREYVAACPAGTHPFWRFFEWQATIPAMTSIEFFVETKATAVDTYQPMAPIPLSTALPATGTGPGTWYRGPQTVDQKLSANMPPLPSLPYLRVTMTFKPTMSMAPTLHEWRQIYDCMPSE